LGLARIKQVKNVGNVQLDNALREVQLLQVENTKLRAEGQLTD